MSEVMIARAPIEPGKEDRLRAWYDELGERDPEVLETLRHEGVYTETAFVHSADDATYLYIYMEAADLEAAHAAGDREAYVIDEEHHAVLDQTLAGEFEELDLVGHFTNRGRK